MLEDLLYGPDGWFTICPPPDWWHRALAENKAPFPWFGGKSKAIDLVWDRFGEVKNYVEPFAGSMAVLLGRPHAPTIETANDFDPFICNFWRATQWDPDRVADYADWPVNECDLHARHKWLVKRKAMLRARLLEDPTFYDARIAGWWVWGLCAWIGSGWCQSQELRVDGTPRQKIQKLAPGAGNNGINAKSMRLPHLGAGTGGEGDHACAHYGNGVHGKGMREQLPHLAGNGEKTDHGRGVHGKGMRLSEQLPFLAGDGKGTGHAIERGVHSQRMRLSEQLPRLAGGADGPRANYGIGVSSKEIRSRLHEVFRAIAQRLRYTRITCGDFERILSPAVTWRHGTTGVFLDPPYPSDAGSTGGIYSTEAHERETFDRAFRWCVGADEIAKGKFLSRGANKDLRIALCYYEGTTVRPAPIDGMPVEGPAEDVSHALRSLGWEIVPWKAGGGYGGQNGRGNENASRERIAFSPHCLRAKQGTLF